jgi:DNA invertase Pin-like site-specific DNA recombinase
MKKVVLFIRKSTIQQEYDHQENLLIDVCRKNDWEIVETIRETISGTKKNEDRMGIGQLRKVVLELKPDIVCCWEISRLTRSPLAFYQLTQFLTENSVSLFIQNLNLHTLDDNGKENHLTGLILAIVSEISKMETLTLKNRVRISLENKRAQGFILGRPKNSKDNKEKTLRKYPEVIKYLQKGLSIREVSRLTSTSINTTLKVSKLIK